MDVGPGDGVAGVRSGVRAADEPPVLDSGGGAVSVVLALVADVRGWLRPCPPWVGRGDGLGVDS